MTVCVFRASLDISSLCTVLAGKTLMKGDEWIFTGFDVTGFRIFNWWTFETGSSNENILAFSFLFWAIGKFCVDIFFCKNDLIFCKMWIAFDWISIRFCDWETTNGDAMIIWKMVLKLLSYIFNLIPTNKWIIIFCAIMVFLIYFGFSLLLSTLDSRCLLAIPKLSPCYPGFLSSLPISFLPTTHDKSTCP